MGENEIATKVLDAAFQLHRELGPGSLESVYEALLFHRLRKQGMRVERQLSVPIRYDGVEIDEGFRLDLLAEGSVIIELKSMESLAPVHGKQVLTYLRLMDLRLELLINFGEAQLKDGIRRIANRL